MRLPIETERLTIRALREEDAEALHEAWSDPEVFRYLPAEPVVLRRGDASPDGPPPRQGARPLGGGGARVG